MKSLIALSTVLAFCLSCHVRAEEACDETAEMKRTAEQYRKCASENKSAKLDECEESSPAVIKNAALKVVSQRQNIGSIEEQLAAAYEAGDKKKIHQLHNQKNNAELECELSEKEKRAAYVVNNVNDLIQNMPDSAEAKQLKAKTDADLKAYLDNAKVLIKVQKEQMMLESKMETIDSKIEIIKKREELKKLEAEAGQG